MKSQAKLLQGITRDPQYVARLQGLESDAQGRQWDNRFMNSRIPEYDAVFDKYCKFNLRRRARSQQRAPPPQHLGGHPVWGRDASSTRQRPLLQPIQRDTSGEGHSVEDLFQRGRAHLRKLWDELGVPEAERLAFAQDFLVFPTHENVQRINDEIQKLLDRRSAAVQVEKAIEVREGFLYLLQELAERASSEQVEIDRAAKELHALISPLRMASLDVVEAIVRWNPFASTPAYLWKGVSYLDKINHDTEFLQYSRLAKLIDYTMRANPLFDPRRVGADMRERRITKDIPRDRLDRATEVLAREAQRVAALGQSTALDSQADVTERHIIVEEEEWLRHRDADERGHDRRVQAASIIQRAYRCSIARRFVNALKIQRAAAIKIQKVARQFVAKIIVRRTRQRVRAAQKLQAIQRGKSTRLRIAHIRREHNAALAIQRVFRGHMGRKYSDMLYLLRCSARKIQAAYRGHRTRKLINGHIATVKNVAATRIQAVWKGYHIRSKPWLVAKSARKIVKLQAWVRGILDRKAVKELLLQRYAATRIQSWYRMIIAQRCAAHIRRQRLDSSWQQYYRVMEVAATKIQATWRMFVAKRQRQELLQEMKRESVMLSKIIEEHRKAELSAVHHKRSVAAIQIQRAVRGFLVRKGARLLRRIHCSATKIQRIFRGRLGRQLAMRRRSEMIEELRSKFLSSTVDIVPHPFEDTTNSAGHDTLSHISVVEGDQSPERPRVSSPETSLSSPQKDDATPDEEQPAIADKAPLAAPVKAEVAVQASEEDAPAARAVNALTQEPPAVDLHADAQAATPENQTLAPETPRNVPVEVTADAPTVDTIVGITLIPPASIDSEKPETAGSFTAKVDTPTASTGVEGALSVPEASTFLEEAAAVTTKESPHSSAHSSNIKLMNDAAQVIQLAYRRWNARKSAAASRQMSLKLALAQERNEAARVIQLMLQPRVQALTEHRRLLQRRKEQRSHDSQASRISERVFAVGLIVRFLRKATLRRRRVPLLEAHAQERYVATMIIAQFVRRQLLRCRIAKAKTTKVAETNQEANYAAWIISRAYRRYASSRPATDEALPILHERKAAAALVKRFLSMCVRKRHHSQRCKLAEQHERASAAQVIQRFFRTYAKPHAAQPVIQKVYFAPDFDGRLPESRVCSAAKVHPRLRRRRMSCGFIPRELKLSLPPKFLVVDEAKPVVTFRAVTFEVAEFAAETPVAPIIDEETPSKPEPLALPGEVEEFLSRGKLPPLNDTSVDEIAEFLARAAPSEPTAATPTSPPPASPTAAPAPPPPSSRLGDDGDDGGDGEGGEAGVLGGGGLFGLIAAATFEPPPAVLPTPAEAAAVVQAALRAREARGFADVRRRWRTDASAGALRRRAAVVVQCAVRQAIARRKARDAAARRAEALRIAAARRSAANVVATEAVVRREEQAQSLADHAWHLQHLQKELVRHRLQEEEESRRQNAALTIQCAYRSYNARFMLAWKKEARWRKRQQEAADSNARAVEKATRKIQRITREFLAKLEVARRKRARAYEKQQLSAFDARRNQAATTIQCMYRVHNARFEVAWRREDKRKREARADQLRRMMEHHQLQLIADLNKHKRDDAVRHRAAVILQCAWRSYNARFELMWRLEAKLKRDAEVRARRQGLQLARVAQKAGRAYIARRDFQISRLRRYRISAQQILPLEL